MRDIPIVVAAFNRVESLKRLFYSLDKAVYTVKVDLIISIDGGADNQAVIQLANRFKWKHGNKKVVISEFNMGLRNHILKCGEFTREYDGIVLLEDDLYVSPYFYTYVIQAHDVYGDEDCVTGIALYSHQYNETACLPFKPVDDGYDVYFMRLACSWGQSWLSHQWELFEVWYRSNSGIDLSRDIGVPPDVRLWPDSSWKKYYIKYITEKQMYFVYPRISLTTNFADPGVNHSGSNNYQTPLLYKDKAYAFPDISESISRYDAYCEVLPEAMSKCKQDLGKYDIEVDLYGMKHKDEIAAEYVLTTQDVSKYVKSYGRKLKPHELNVYENITGDDIKLGLTSGLASYGSYLIYRNKVNQDYIRTHGYFYAITKWHYTPTVPQRQVSMHKRLYNKVRRVLKGWRA